MNTMSTQHNEEVVDLSHLFHQLLGNKWLILSVCLICLSLGMFYASRQVPQYQAELLIQVYDPHNNAGGMLSNMVSQITIGGNKDNPAAIQAALVKSRFILEQVNESLGLDLQVRIKQNFWEKIFSPMVAAVQIKSFRVPRDAFNKPFFLIYDKPKHFKLFNKKNKLILEGEVGKIVSNSAHTMQIIIEKIKNPVGTRFTLVKRSATNVVKWLSSRVSIKDLGDKQRIGILEVSFKDSNPVQAVSILNKIAEVTQVQDARKKSIEASKTLEFLYHQLPIAKNNLERAELKLNRYREKSGKIDIKIQTSALLNQLAEIEKNLAVLRLNRVEMLQRYTTKHPTIIALDTQVKGLRHDRDKLEATLRTFPASDQIAVNIMREVDVKTKLYMALLAKIQELQVIKAGTVSDVRILSLAQSPDQPLPLKNSLIYVVSLVFGGLLSAGIIFLRMVFFPRIEDPQWIEKNFNIVNLAIIPFSKEQSTQSVSISGKHISLLSQTNPRSLAVESLRSLRTSSQITLSCASNNIITVLGASPGVGKSFIATNLAYLLATAGKRVLLIDADLRRGTAHKYFGLPASPGFAEILNGTSTVDVALNNTALDNLMVLSRGKYPSDPSELLATAFCKEFIHEMAKQFDIVVIDTAPILLVTDAVLVSVFSATNYLVLGARSHQPAEIEMAIKRLKNAGVHLNGTIFNFYNAESKKSSYYNSYNSYSYYYDDESAV